ncbi:MAG TPA: sulfurtransferase TusA family protein [Tissierellia bacterium]|nr:sulfurtransferase TusA family protein [Tissierellia bacterium]
MIKLDARGLSCPEPLMMVADAMKKHPGEEIEILVSEMHTKTNVENFCHDKGRAVEVTPQEFDILIHIK